MAEQATLFETPRTGVDGYGPSRGPIFDALNAACRRKLGAAAEWRWFAWEAVNRKNPHLGDLLVRGAVPTGTTKSGRPKWPKDSECDRVVISDADIEAACVAYERESGKCAKCVEGHRPNGWSAAHGISYKSCERCDGTGVPLARGVSGEVPAASDTPSVNSNNIGAGSPEGGTQP